MVNFRGLSAWKHEQNQQKGCIKSEYISPNQLTLAGFETSFERNLNPKNRWVVLAHLIPLDDICNLYLKTVKSSTMGHLPLSPRLILGLVISKIICTLDDWTDVDQMSENFYKQSFLGFTSFSNVAPLDPSLFVGFRKKLGNKQLVVLNDRIVALKAVFESQKDVHQNRSL
jgi:IS5 family transposase